MWMICAWFLRFLFNPGKRPQVVLIGTDPVLGLIASIGIRAVDPKVKIAHWCFDLYPEAAAADKKIKDNSWGYRFLNWMMNCAYRACDLIVDLGSCMRQRLEKYSSNAVRETLTPWAFYEPAQVRPADPKEKCNMFGDASLGILYSGNFGLAHSADLVGQLACGLAAEKIRFSFSIRGHGEKAFRKKCLDNQWPISFAEFVSEERLNLRLEAADIHIVSLKSDWTGTVVPSKFFGALAAGRPVIFEGSEDSAVALWIQKYELGWVLTPQSLDSVRDSIKRISQSPEDLRRLQEHCHRIYQQFFSRQLVTSKWNELLQNLV